MAERNSVAEAVRFGCAQELCHGKDCNDQSSVSFGLYFQSAAELPQALSHSAKSDTAATRFDHFALFLDRYTLATILNLNNETVTFPVKADCSGSVPRMAVDVSQTFLDDAEDGDFHIGRQAPEIGGSFQIHLDIAAFREAVYLPTKRGG